MKYSLTLIFTILLFSSCLTLEKSRNNEPFEISHKIYFLFNETDSINISDLRFVPFYDSKEVQKLMFQKFGKWNNTLDIGNKKPYLVWTEIKLFDWNDERYFIAAGWEDFWVDVGKVNGKKDTARFNYCSVIIVNSEGIDCLKEEYAYKDSITKFFIKGVSKTNINDEEFEKEYNKLKLDM